MKIAFIGLGNMGTGIAQCILKSGHDLIVWNRTATKTGPLVALGARAATTAREAAAAADVVITSLMDDKSVLDVVQAGDGMLAGMRPDAIHACVTTISPECADELERLHRGHGSFYVSAPVAGRPDAAASGRFASFLGGPANAVERLMPACKSYSTSVTVISERPRIWFAHPAPKMYAEKRLKRDFAGRGGFVMTGGLKDVRLMTLQARSQDRLQGGISFASIDGADKEVSERQGCHCCRSSGSRAAKFGYRYAAADSLWQQGGRSEIGARYRSDGWYAPPGFDLSAFEERGWL